MRILIVSQYFWPENFRINDLASELVKRGHDVSVLTGLPNYPAGKVFETFRKSPQKYESYHGCQIYRVPIFPRGSGSFRLLLNYVSYVVSACLIGGVKLRRAKFDIIFVYEPSPVTVCLPAIFIKAFKKIPIVFWVQDLWPETLEAIGIVKSQKLLRLIGVGVRYIYDRCDLILGQSQAFHAGISKYCHDEKKNSLLPELV
ncbi:glycosyltransferase [uncultured Desulfuromusa sp.]|uniref:glycosyltransferase n=1 Tax=uncultured Desulfuromusa sp. TaxID=219183 RepID=UPI002AA76757|nr:glycosyltransferase [uncultured Desulfuromusa sp.]